MFDRSHTDPRFAAKYQAPLRRGFDAEPETLPASFGIRLDDPATIQPVANLLLAKTAELKRLYGAEDK